MRIRNGPIVFADIVSENIVVPWTCIQVLEKAISRSLVFVRQTILHYGMGNSAIQVKSSSASSANRGFVPIGKAMLNNHTVCFKSPDTNRTISFAGHVPSVIGGSTIFNKNIRASTHYNTITAMVV